MKKIFLRKESPIPFTQEGYNKLVEEKEKLTGERPEAVRHLAESRAMGDLSENGYYKASRQQLSFLDSRIRRVERLLRLAKIVEPSNSGRVEIGSTVTVNDGMNTITYSIVGGYESNPAQKTISHMSPLGRALMGKSKNETIELNAPSGIKKYTILNVS